MTHIEINIISQIHTDILMNTFNLIHGVSVMVFNATFNNISVISWR